MKKKLEYYRDMFWFAKMHYLNHFQPALFKTLSHSFKSFISHFTTFIRCIIFIPFIPLYFVFFVFVLDFNTPIFRILPKRFSKRYNKVFKKIDNFLASLGTDMKTLITDMEKLVANPKILEIFSQDINFNITKKEETKQ